MNDNVPRILVVDDDQPILLLMRNILREFKFDPTTAATGTEAIELASSTPPDLILLDKNMPEMTGDEIVRRFRAMPALQNVPILILSGEPVTPDELQLLGADGAIQKPFDLAELIRRIRLHLESA